MNPRVKLFVAVVLAGMFLLPPAAAAGGSDSSAATPADEPVSKAASDGVHNSHIDLTKLQARGETKATAKFAPAARPENINVLTPEYGPGAFAKSRGPRAGPDIYVAARGISLISPEVVRIWNGPGVYALKGAQTQINITINNSGDGDANPVTVTVKILDAFNAEVMNEVRDIGSIAAGTNTTVYFYWTPAYCTYWELNITLSTPGDTDPSNDQADVWNNGFAYLGVALWADSCSATTGYNGDIGSNTWHITTTEPALDNATQHTAPECWYEGGDIRKQYDNNLDISVRSPSLDLRNFPKSYFLQFDYLFHGSLPALDAGDYFEQSFTSDNGATYGDPYVHMDGAMLAGSTINIDWFNWYTDLNQDGQAQGTESGLDLSQEAGKIVQFRDRFVSNAANPDTGIYIDDFCVWGMEIQYDADVQFTTSLNGMKTNEAKSITAKVTNNRGAQPTAFSCNLNITRRGDPTHMLSGFPMVKQVSALAKGASQDITFDWTPIQTGDFVAHVNITGCKDQDPYNNYTMRAFHVSGASPKILVVDDNPFGGALESTTQLVENLTDANVGGYTSDELALWYTLYESSLIGSDFGGDGPSDTVMKQFEIVVWTTGWDSKNETKNGTLTANDLTNIKSYLNSGGAMWLMSQGLINDLYPGTFVSDHLHVSSAVNDTTIKGGMFVDQHILPSPMNGTPGSLADGASYYVAPPAGINWSYDEADLLQLDDSAPGVSGVFYSDGEQSAYVALQVSGSYRLVFQTFDYTWIQLPEHRKDYIYRVISYLTGGLEMSVMGGGVATSHLMVDPGGTVEYTLTIYNGGTKTRTLWNVDISNPPSSEWTVKATPMVIDGDPPVDIAYDESLDIVLTVTAPQKALAGLIADINVSMTFSNYGKVLFNHTVTEVRAILGTEFVATTTEQNLTGPGTASYSFTLRNKGNIQVVAELLRSGDRSEWITLGSPTVTLQPWEERLLSAVLTVPDGVYREAGNYTLRDNITSRVTYLGNVSTANLSLTTRIRIAQVFSAKIDDFTLDPSDGQVDMSVQKPTAKLTVKVTAQSANGYDNVTIELKGKSFTPMSGSQRPFTGEGWTLPKTTLATTPFMMTGKETGQLSILVPPKADAGDYVIEIRVTPGSGLIADGDTTQITIVVAKPDLLVAEGSMSFSPKEPEVGTPVKIKVTVKNIGGVLAKNVDVSFYTSGENLIETKQIANLAATTGSASVEITWEGIALGENEIMVRVDPGNVFSELDETNNEITDIVVGYRSDLVIEAVPLFYKENRPVTKVYDGDTVTIEVTVKNAGAYALNLTGIKVKVTDQKTGEELPLQVVPSIATRQELKVTFIWTVKKTGDHTFEVRVNPNGATDIPETSYDNNMQTATLKVVEKPKPPINILEGGMMLYVLIGVVAIVIVVALLAVVMMRRRPGPKAAPAPAAETADVVEAEAVEAEQK